MNTHGLIPCTSCGKVGTDERVCERCGARVWRRRPFSIQKSWAWWLAGITFYIPANIQPMLYTEALGDREANTVIGGVVELAAHGSIGIAAIVFVASVVVPLAKFGIIAGLLLSIQQGWPMSAHTRTELYHLTELIGRWSMIDVFVVAVLAAIVQLGTLTQIDAGPAAAPFAAAVICTMLSAMAIDTRLIWDTEVRE